MFTKIKLSKKITLKDKIEFWSYLTHLSQNSIPLVQSLSMMRSFIKNGTMTKIIDQIISALNQGNSLGKALEAFPQFFSSGTIHLLLLAEQIGGYSPIFARLEQQEKWRADLQQLIRQSLRYPLILLLTMIVFMIILIGWLIPNMTDYLKLIHYERLPFVSTSLIYISQHLCEIGYSILIGCISCWIWSWYRYFRHQKPLKYFIPILGILLYQLQILNFAHHLGLLLKAKIDILGALFYAAESVSCPWLKNKMKDQEAYLIQGISLSHALGPILGEDSIISKIIRIGENTSELDDLLLTTTAYELQQVQQRLKNVLEFLQPMMILLMGSLLGWTVFAILLPLYDNIGGIHG